MRRCCLSRVHEDGLDMDGPAFGLVGQPSTIKTVFGVSFQACQLIGQGEIVDSRAILAGRNRAIVIKMEQKGG
jgi:hypothetical protein